MRVMHLIGSPKPGGAETFFLRMVQALGEKCDVLPVARRGSWLAAQLKEAGMDFRTAPFGGFFDIGTARLLRGYAASFRPDVIQCWMNRAASRAPAHACAVSVGRLGGYYDLKYYRDMDYLVANTEDIVRHITDRGWPAARVRHLPNFAEQPPGGFRSLGKSVRACYGIPEDAFVLLAAGRLHENKGFDVLLTAFGRLPERAHLFLAGEGPMERALRTAAARAGVAGRVRFLGWVRQLSGFCAASDLWVAPSRHEPLGNVVLDAWMHGLPVVATATAGPASLIEDGETGILVAAGDPAPLAAAIEALMADAPRRLRLAQRGNQRARTRFSRDKVIAGYLDFYRLAIEGGKRRGRGGAPHGPGLPA